MSSNTVAKMANRNVNRKLIFNLNCKLLLSLFLLPRESSKVAATDQSFTCEFCCPYLFDSSKGIINVRDSPSLLHSISYIIRCLLSTDEVVIVSDGASTHPFWLNWERYKNDERRKRVCTQVENVLLSYIQATDFLQSDLGYFQKLVPTYDPAQSTSSTAMMAKRTNFIFISDSQEQMISLIAKVEKELQHLRIGRKFFWQPYIIFLWPEVQHHFRNGQTNEEKTYNDEIGQSLLQSWFGNYQPYFTLDSGIFMFFIVEKGNSTRSKMNLYLSVWECYKLKGKFILQEVVRHLGSGFKENISSQEKCNDTSRNASPMISWMEKVNSYVLIERFSRRDDFQLLPVTASIVPSDSTDWIIIKRNENGMVKLASGSSVDIYRNFQVMMNFSDDILLGDGVQFSASLASRNESSATFQLEKADILLNQKSVTPGRGQIYSFLQPTYYGIYEAFFRQPSESTIRNIVSAPFTVSLWAITITTWLLIIGCLYGWGYVAKRNFICSDNDKEFIRGIGMWAVAAISQKSWYISPSLTNFKAIFYLGSIMALVCYTAYSAIIVSFLTVKTVPIQTLNDLIGYKYKFTVHESSEATMSLLQEMINKYRLSQTVIKINTENEITHLEHRTNALLSYPDLFYRTADQQNYTEDFICSQVYSLPAGNMPYKSSMSVRKGSQFRETFSAKLLIIMERGLNFRYKRIYDDSKAINCPKKNLVDQRQERTTLDPVRLTDVFTTFLAIFIGWFLALWIFVTERLYRRRRTLYTFMFLIH